MRERAYKKAKSLGLSAKIENELVPDDEHIHGDLRSCIGKPIKVFYDKVLTGKFRNSVAHFITTEQRVLHVSSPVELHEYANVAFVCDLCVRVLIKNHERLVAQLQAKGA